MNKKDLPALYTTIGQVYRDLDAWSMYLITSYEDGRALYRTQGGQKPQVIQWNDPDLFLSVYGSETAEEEG